MSDDLTGGAPAAETSSVLPGVEDIRSGRWGGRSASQLLGELARPQGDERAFEPHAARFIGLLSELPEKQEMPDAGLLGEWRPRSMQTSMVLRHIIAVSCGGTMVQPDAAYGRVRFDNSKESQGVPPRELIVISTPDMALDSSIEAHLSRLTEEVKKEIIDDLFSHSREYPYDDKTFDHASFMVRAGVSVLLLQGRVEEAVRFSCAMRDLLSNGGIVTEVEAAAAKLREGEGSDADLVDERITSAQRRAQAFSEHVSPARVSGEFWAVMTRARIAQKPDMRASYDAVLCREAQREAVEAQGDWKKMMLHARDSIDSPPQIGIVEQDLLTYLEDGTQQWLAEQYVVAPRDVGEWQKQLSDETALKASIERGEHPDEAVETAAKSIAMAEAAAEIGAFIAGTVFPEFSDPDSQLEMIRQGQRFPPLPTSNEGTWPPSLLPDRSRVAMFASWGQQQINRPTGSEGTKRFRLTDVPLEERNELFIPGRLPYTFDNASSPGDLDLHSFTYLVLNPQFMPVVLGKKDTEGSMRGNFGGPLFDERRAQRHTGMLAAHAGRLADTCQNLLDTEFGRQILVTYFGFSKHEVVADSVVDTMRRLLNVDTNVIFRLHFEEVASVHTLADELKARVDARVEALKTEAFGRIDRIRREVEETKETAESIPAAVAEVNPSADLEIPNPAPAPPPPTGTGGSSGGGAGGGGFWARIGFGRK